MPSARELVNKHSRTTVAVLVVVVLLAVYAGAVQMREAKPTPRPQPKAFYYDQNTGELFTMPISSFAPVDRPSGEFNGEPAGVKAHVFACGDCVLNEMFVGWLEKPNPDDDEDRPLEEGELPVLIRSIDDPRWYLSDSPQASKIVSAARGRCPRRTPATYCTPRHQELKEKYVKPE